MRCALHTKQTLIGLLAAVLSVAFVVPAYGADDGNWRRGRIYYRLVCTVCHKDMADKKISPMSRTIAEWKTYVSTDKHDRTGKANPSLKYYVSQDYRASVKDTNKAAAKFIAIPESDLLNDLRAWVVHGAKDSDTPARCQ
ncbi:MAG: hypothetical protein HOH04_07565 [Rhodospirillaceae bacterium]|jgi:hypothetical protein|nr:hypothetical protein [Rhodospirillaceae bacterium]